MAKNLPNIGKPVPELTDPANIKVVSDAIEAAANALGLPVTNLTTTAKSIVPAINELKTKADTLEANISSLNLGLIDDPLSVARNMSSQTYAIAFSNGTYDFGDRSTYAAFQLYRRWSMSFVIAYRLDGKISYARHDGNGWLDDGTGTWNHKF